MTSDNHLSLEEMTFDLETRLRTLASTFRRLSHDNMALARTLAAVRAGVLTHLRVPATGLQYQAAPATWQLVRGFAEGTYLNKDDVTERVLNVVKNFDQKVDQSKVHMRQLRSSAVHARFLSFH